MAGPMQGRGQPDRGNRLPADYDDDGLKRQLAGVQSRARRLMDEHGVASRDMLSMAREAERSIGDDARRAEFLRLLIELHEFGGEAKRRGLLRRPVQSRPAEQVAEQDRDTRLYESNATAGDEVDDDVAREFFDRLDR